MKLVKSNFLILIVCRIFSCSNDNVGNKEETWWKETVFYEIYMPSYKDSNSEGQFHAL